MVISDLTKYIDEMQFIDFNKEHFSKKEGTEEYFIEILKDDIGFGDIEVQEKQDESFSKAEYQLVNDADRVTIIMKGPSDIRVNF